MEIKPETVSLLVADVQTMAMLFDLDPRRIQQLAKEDILVKHKQNSYKVFQSLINYLNWLRRNPKKKNDFDINEPDDGEKISLEKEQALLARSKREAQVMANEKMRGNLVEISEVEEFNKAIALLFIRALDSFEARLTPEITTVTQCDDSLIRPLIAKECRLTRIETADKLLTFNQNQT